MSKFERNKDLAQEVVSNAAESAGAVAKIISGTVVDVTKQIAGTVADARDHLRESGAVHEVVATTAESVGEITRIITDSVAGVTREIGDTVTDGIEMREATQKAKIDDEADLDLGEDVAEPADDEAAGDDKPAE